MRKTYRSIPTALLAQVASTSIEPIPPFGSPTFQRGQLSLAKRSEASIKTERRRCAFCVSVLWRKKGKRLQRKCQLFGQVKWELATVQREFGPIITRRIG